ncbi:hypothetical protein [Lysobacter sp. 1R34A]|uniref:hypothetical protein n=1 Tax=Lysobacter sp. 1R34A TaxID=3445786 RepID=UPI003EE8425B
MSGTERERGNAGRLARWTSIVLHPFAVFIGLTMVSVRVLAPQAFWSALCGVATAVLVSWAFVAQRRRGGHWTTVDASHPSERPLLYAVLLAVLAACWWWMRERAAPMGQGILAVAAMVVAAALLNRWIKLSLHMASLAFAAVSLCSLQPALAALAIALLPLLAWSRLKLARHSLAEVIGGTLLGAAFACGLRVLAG